MGSSEAAVTAKASVMPSRRDQRKQADVKLMPPPPSLAPPARPAAPVQPLQPQASTSGYTPPPWAGQPPRGTSLQVLKDGVPVQDIPLLLPATVFGRSAPHRSNNAPCKSGGHSAVSRQHDCGSIYDVAKFIVRPAYTGSSLALYPFCCQYNAASEMLSKWAEAGL